MVGHLIDTCNCCGVDITSDISTEWISAESECLKVEDSSVPYAIIETENQSRTVCEYCYVHASHKGMTNSELAELHYQFGLVYSEMGRLAKAKNSLLKSVELIERADTLVAIATLVDDEEAVSLYRRAIHLEPSNHVAKQNLMAITKKR